MKTFALPLFFGACCLLLLSMMLLWMLEMIAVANRQADVKASKQAGSESCIMNDSLKREVMVLMSSVSIDEVVLVVVLVI